MTKDAYKYWAFISYSHRNNAAGEWLHKSLETYRIAKSVQGKHTPLGPIPARITPIFRDREELAASPDLGDRIEAALAQSRYLLVVCTPAAAASPWVDKEIVYFKTLGREDRIFSLIAEGEPYASEKSGREADECFPKALRFRLGADRQISDVRAEPLAADMRADKDGKQNALLKLIAGMLGVGFDDLRQRQLEARNAWLRKIVAASVALVLVFAALAIYAFAQQRLAEQRMRLAMSRQLAAQSGALLETSPDLPMLLSLEALSADDTVEARRSLFDALMVTRRSITLVRSPVKMALNSLALSPDGKTLVSGGRDGQLVFWDLTTDPPQTEIKQSGTRVNDLSVSKDGRFLAVAEADGAIGLWDLASRQRANSREIPKQPGDVTALTFGPGNLLAFGYSVEESYDARKLVLWDLAAGSALRTIDTSADGSVSVLAFSPDGRTLASAAVGGDTTLWDVATGSDIHSEFLKDTASVAFSPDGKLLASGSWQLTVRKTENFDAVTFPLPDAPAHIGAVQFSPDGKFLASASSNGNLVVWNPASRKPREDPFQLMMGSLHELVLSPNGRTVYVGNDAGQIGIVRLDTAPLRKLVRTGAELFDVSFNPARGEVASIDDKGNVSFWDASSLDRLRKIPASPGAAAVIAVSPDGATLAVGDYKGRLSFWDSNAAKPLSKPAQVKADRIDRIRFSPDGLTVAIVSFDPEVVLWDAKENERIAAPLAADSKHARDAIFSNDGDRLFTAGDDGEILEWDWRAGERVGSPMKSPQGVAALALSPDGNHLAVGGYDNRVTLWDVTQKQMAGVALVAHTNYVRAVSFSPDGKLIASGGDDGLAILWDVTTRQPIAQFRHGASVFSGDGTARTARAVNHVSFSLDGTMLAADGLENDILIWDVDIASWRRQACQRINRNLSEEEWNRFVGNTPYLETCPVGKPRAN